MKSPLIAFFQIQATLLKARFFLAFGNFEQAQGLMKNAITKFPDNPKLLSVLQSIYRNNAEWDAYLDIFRIANNLFHQSLTVKRNTGTALLYFRHYSEALSYLEFCIDHWNLGTSHPNFQANIYAQLGICYTYLQEWSLAQQALQMAQALSYQDPDLVYGTILLYIGTSRHEEILGFLDDIIKKDPDNYAFYYWRAIVMDHFFHDSVSALRWYEMSLNRILLTDVKELASKYYAIGSDAIPRSVLQEYVKALVSYGKRGKATTMIFLNKLRLWNDPLDIYGIQIDLDILNGNLETAEKKCRAAVNKKSYRGISAYYWRLLALAQLKQGKLAESFQSIHQALECDSELDEAWEVLGQIQMRQQDWASAAQTYQKILTIDPFDFKSWENKGACHFQLGELALAKEAYEKAVKLNPFEADTWVDLGQIYHNLGEPLLAAAACKKGLGFHYATQEKRLIAESILNLIGNVPQ